MISKVVSGFSAYRLQIILCAAGFFSFSCSNTKDGFVNRTFHNLSAHYNGYYNAGLKLEDGLDKLSDANVDHYDRPLSIFPYADASKAKSIYPQLDDAMKRTSTVIQRHTLVDKRGNEKPDKEKWIDDNWILYGKSQFFKHDYFEALETFKFVEATYKKEAGRHIASMWIAKTYLELTELRDAENKLDYLRNQPDFPKKSKWELDAVNADFYLQTKNVDKAIQFLTLASAEVKDRETKIRFLFILAQLNQIKTNYKLAFDLYTRVIKMNPKYEMAFNARLNRARCYDSNSGSSQSVHKELLKMEKDPKNKDFLDQIYFALAGLAKNEGKQDEEITFLNQSIKSSVSNQNQKALSYLELAKISYAKPDYRNAQAYYDSVTTNLSNDYPDYTEILTRRNSLTRLVKFLRTIETEDSLQALAKLSPAEQQKIVDDYIVKENDAKKKLQEDQQSNQIFDPGRPADASQFNRASGSNWYFYNAQAVSFGFNEFVKKFGDRKLEDNWRRSKKEIVGISDEVDVTIPGDSIPGGADSSKTADNGDRKTNMLKSIPADTASLDKSTNKIIEAYYNIGMIYREQLADMNAATGSFEELIRRYPENKFKLQSYYQLYRIYASIGNTAKSEYYKNIILNKYSDTEYAEIIRNPNYATDKAKQKSELEVFYEDTYRKYLNGEYRDVIVRKSQSDVQFPQNPLASKFDMLKTLSIGKTQPAPVFEASLNDIIRNYSTDSVKDVAEEILDYIHNKNVNLQAPDDTASVIASSGANTNATASSAFKYLPDTTHEVILIFQNIGGPLNPVQLKNKLSNFNGSNFSTESISIQDLLFDHRNKILIMKDFSGKQAALKYASLLTDNDEVFGNVSGDAYQLFVISANNLPTLLTLKKTDEYDTFYRNFYR